MEMLKQEKTLCVVYPFIFKKQFRALFSIYFQLIIIIT